MASPARGLVRPARKVAPDRPPTAMAPARAPGRGNQAHLRHLADAAEQEADRFAGATGTGGRAAPPQRAAAPRTADRLGRSLAAAGLDGARLTGGGERLPEAVRAPVETTLGAILPEVWLHRGPQAAAANAALGARAFTYGAHVWLGDGEDVADRELMAHELAHVLQQARTGEALVQAWLRDDTDVSIVRIIAFAGSTKGAQAVLSDPMASLVPIELSRNTMSPGTYEFRRDDDASGGYIGSDPLAAPGEIYWRPGSIFRHRAPRAPVVTVVVLAGGSASLQASFNALPPAIQRFFTSDDARRASNEELQQIVDAGRNLAAAGVSEDELLRLEYGRGGSDATATESLGDAVDDYLDDRAADTAQAQDVRHDLVQYGNRLASLANMPYPLPHLVTLQNQLPEPLRILDRDIAENTAFSGVMDLRTTLNRFAEALDQELFGLAMAVLNGVDAGLIRMQQSFVGNFPDRVLPSTALMGEIARIKTDPNVADALGSLEAARAQPPDPLEVAASILTPIKIDSRADKVKKLEKTVDAAVSRKSALKLRSGAAADILEATTGEAAQNRLAGFILDGRATVQRARNALDLDDPGTVYWDKIVAMEKQRMGIRSGTVMNWVIDEIAEERRTETSFWGDVWSVFKVVVTFVPGPLGFALRAAAAVVDADQAISRYRHNLDAYNTGLSSQEPSLNALYEQLTFTAAGVAVDASLTSFAPATAGARLNLSGGLTRTAGDEAANVATRTADEAADTATATATPATDTPTTDTPTSDTPTTDTPTTDTSTVEEPADETTATDRPATDRPATDRPAGDEPAAPSADHPAATPAGGDAGRADLRTRLDDLEADRLRLRENLAEKQRLVDAKRAEIDRKVAEKTQKLNFSRAKSDPEIVRAQATLDKRVATLEKMQQDLRQVEKDIDATNRALHKGARPWRSAVLDTKAKAGLYNELEATTALQAKGWTPMGKTVRPDNIVLAEDFDTAVEKYQGQQGIDGIYRGGGGKPEFAIVESKPAENALRAPTGVGRLQDTTTRGYQLSRNWVEDNLKRAGLTAEERAEIEAALKDGRVHLVYAQTDSKTTRFFNVEFDGDDGVRIGDAFD